MSQQQFKPKKTPALIHRIARRYSSLYPDLLGYNATPLVIRAVKSPEPVQEIPVKNPSWLWFGLHLLRYCLTHEAVLQRRRLASIYSRSLGLVVEKVKGIQRGEE